MFLVVFTSGMCLIASASLFLLILVSCLGSFLRCFACILHFVLMHLCRRGDEDVEDVFFLDDGANVIAAVSDR